MDVYATRYRNFRSLVEQVGGVTAAANRLRKAQAQVSHFGGENPTKNIGHKVAREIEAAFGLPHGWLDTERHGKQEVFSGGESHLLRPDADILHAALTLLVYDEDPVVGAGPYRPREQAVRLADLYEWVAKEGGRLSAASNAQFLEQVEARRAQKGSHAYAAQADEAHRRAG